LKRAFVLAFGVWFVVMLAIGAYLSLKSSLFNITRVKKEYLNAQAALYLKGAKEYAGEVLKEHNFSAPLDKIVLNYPGFEVKIDFFVFRNECSDKKCVEIETNESNLTSLVFISVESTNPHFHIRKTTLSLQKR